MKKNHSQTKNNKILNVVILGCGNIGAFYDIKTKKSTNILSHLKGFLKNKNFNVEAIVDNNKNKIKKVLKEFKVNKHYYSIKDLKNDISQIDVVSICTPTRYHFEHIKEIISLKPKLIFCEKPLSYNFETAKKIVKICKKHNIILVVNFLRRWDPFLSNFKIDIKKEKYGKLNSIQAISNNGALNYGSHLMDLFFYLFDNLNEKDIKIIKVDGNNFNVSLRYKDKKELIPINIILSNDDLYSLFEIEFIFSKFIIKMFNGGRYWGIRKIIKDDDFNKNLNPGKLKFVNGKILNSMPMAIQNIYEIINLGYLNKSDGLNALRTQKLCEKFK